MNWCNYTYLDEMKSDALYTLARNALKFDENKSTNVFAYYTQIIKLSFITRLDQEQKQGKIRDAVSEHYGMMPSFQRQLDDLEEQRSGQ
jgi:hypothetical protein